MYKLVVFTALLAAAAAAPGYLGAPLAAPYGVSPWGQGLVGAPWGQGLVGAPWGHGLVGAPVVKTALPVATSYANTVRVASPVVAAHGPVLASPYAHGPVLASPYAHGSVLASPYAHGW